MSHRAFISYASQNRSYADEIYSGLKTAGLSCWMAPHDIAPAESWLKAITQGVQDCDVLVLLLCAHANSSKFVLREVARAVHYDKKILTVRLEDLAPCEELSFLISLEQWLEASSHPLDVVVARIIQTVESLAKAAGPDNSSTAPDPLDAMPLEDLIEEGLELVAEEIGKLAASETPATPRDLGLVLDTAIFYGAPAYNRGAIAGCVRIYLTMAQALVEAVEFASVAGNAPWQAPFQRFAEQLENLLADHPPTEGPAADELAWALRHVFDRFHAARGIQAVDDLIRELEKTGRPVMRDLAAWPLLVAIKHGNIVFQANDLQGCAELHHFTGRRVCELMDSLPAASPPDPQVLALRQSLEAILREHPQADAGSSSELAWELYGTFLEMLQSRDG